MSRWRMVIGNGSSGIQILPEMAKLPGTTVTSFQRGPTCKVSRHQPAKLIGRDDPNPNPEYLPEEKEKLRDPEEMKKCRKNIQGTMNRNFRLFRKGSEYNAEMTEFATKQMAEKLNHDPVLCEKLIPKYELGCRRITPGSGYLEAFTQSNVHLTNSEIKWKDEPESYISLACPDMPNMFFTGPNATVGHGSLIFSLDWSAEWMLRWIGKVAHEDIASIAPKQEVVDEFCRYSDQIHKTLTWTGGCRSWYKANRVNGRVTATFAGSAILYEKLVNAELRGEDFDIRYRSANRWRFLGNGFTQYELEPGNDLAYYIP
ncbi:uncharacterized protein MYCFIDRAFT_78439 [Pseudocercospora fijiensis CIRAD86]|uniref:Uncharacterized protein n=1 Tax=Pseudocercospora fijiensis (strain CIRAD86) TaxID=383855 RepID=N1QD53_PSEFD|nr:uncharacterized protein MYCFIDRAFT_78439 [Pseudocercospora fijiensis CIRAD86]EME89783.1 hypothetical protein MYCFIDRAFT_78439 [Pseudocercospora fijiensis CIRAD86]